MTIGQICSIVGGGTPDTNNKEYWNGGIQWFTPSEVGKEKYVSDSNRTISIDGLRNSSAKLLPPYSILLSSRATVGECSINLKECCTNQGFQSAVPNSSITSTEFLYYRLLTHKRDFIKKACGSTFLEISAKQISKLNTCIPAKPEQKKVADLLSLIDERITIQNKVIEKYESLIKALCNHLFSVGRNDVRRISDLGEYFSTMNLSKGDLSISGEECVLYGELFTTYGRVINEIKSRTKATDGAVRSHNNDLLFPASTTVDALSLISPAAITKGGVVLGGDMFGIRVQPNLDNRYLSYLLYYCYRERFAGYAQGSTIIHLHYNDIKNIEIRIHDNATQKRIAHLLSILETMKANQEKALSFYSIQKAFLLKELFI